MEKETVHGLRCFLLTVLEMQNKNCRESCETIETYIAQGVASRLYSKYKEYFDRNGFNPDYMEGIDEYYKQWDECANGCEERKYAVSDENGLSLLIALALNKFS